MTLPSLLQLQEIPAGFLQWAGRVDRSELLGVSRIPDLPRIAEVSLYTELCISDYWCSLCLGLPHFAGVRLIAK